MKDIVWSPRKTGFSIILVLLLVLFSGIVGWIVSIQLNSKIHSSNPEAVRAISGLSELIEKDSSVVMIQKKLDEIITVDKRFGDLVVIDDEAIIIAALDHTAVGQNYPIVFKANTIKGLPLPFDYSHKDFSHQTNLYKPQERADMMFQVFGRYQSMGHEIYYIVGSYQYTPELIGQVKVLGRIIMISLYIYKTALILFWFLLAWWVYVDARPRGINSAAWGILTLLTSVIGWAAYLVTRPAMNVCWECGQEQIQGLNFCTACGSAMKVCCSKCGRQIEENWQFCGECGQSLEIEHSG